VRITRDHSWVQDQIDRGLIRPEDARGHPSSNLITRAIGIDSEPAPDLYAGSIQDGDQFVLASDGLTDMISDQRIAEVLASEEDPDQVVERLIAEANEEGGSDNISVLLVSVRRLEQ
jgi:protein phosphatase